jgi:hypothetical protein
MTPTETSASPPPSAPLLARIASFVDRRPNVVLPVWIFAYFAVLWRPAHRPLWFDELLTYYVSAAPSAGSYLHTRFLDPTPPLSYFFFRASIALFGDSPFAARLPSLLGFLGASLIVYRLIARRLGGAIGLAALGIFWSSSLTVYAVEARPYGLLLAWFALATLCWWNAITTARWTMWHAGLALSIAAMFLTHCFSPPFAAAIGAAELVRAVASRRIDKRVWAALLAPISVLPLYLPLVKDARALLCPPAFAATLVTVPKIYLAILAPLLPSIGAIVLIFLAAYGRGPRALLSNLARPHEIAFAIASFLAPLVTICYSHWSGAPFWLRYAIGAIAGATLILAALLALATRRNSNLAAAAAGLILMLFCVTRAGTGHLVEWYDNTSTGYRAVRPDLPFVTASGLTFLEMDRREQPAFLSRLYYLTDRDSALRYHTNIFEGMPILKQWFPVRANIELYRDFTSRNRQFLVLATQGFPEDWLLLKLAEDGAQIRLLREENTGYRDRELYEVTLRP